jgi:chromosome segregation ATPase
MGPQKKQDTTSSSNNISKIQKDIQKLSKVTKKLQTNYKLMSKSLKDLKNSIELLTKTVQSNKDVIDNLPAELETTTNEVLSLLSDNIHGERVKIDKENFIPALKIILKDLKNEEEKEYVDIKTVKKGFMKRYYLEFDANFDQWLLESYWSNEIELISGISDYAVRDIYDNVYHHIKF